MQKTLIIFFVFLLTSCFSHEQRPNTGSSDAKVSQALADTLMIQKSFIKHFLNEVKDQIFTDPALYISMEPIKFQNESFLFIMEENTNNHFLLKDSSFLKEQIVQHNNLLWGYDMVDGMRLVEEFNLNTMYSRKLPREEIVKKIKFGLTNYIYKLSIALFNRERNVALINVFINNDCQGAYLLYFKKIKGVWLLHKRSPNLFI